MPKDARCGSPLAALKLVGCFAHARRYNGIFPIIKISSATTGETATCCSCLFFWWELLLGVVGVVVQNSLYCGGPTDN